MTINITFKQLFAIVRLIKKFNRVYFTGLYKSNLFKFILQISTSYMQKHIDIINMHRHA